MQILPVPVPSHYLGLLSICLHSGVPLKVACNFTKAGGRDKAAMYLLLCPTWLSCPMATYQIKMTHDTHMHAYIH